MSPWVFMSVPKGLLLGQPPQLELSCLLPDAYDMAKLLCDKYYMASPDLEIQEVNGKQMIMCLSVCTCVYMCVNVSVHTCAYVYMYMYVYVCVHVCMCVPMQARIGDPGGQTPLERSCSVLLIYWIIAHYLVYASRDPCPHYLVYASGKTPVLTEHAFLVLGRLGPGIGDH